MVTSAHEAPVKLGGFKEPGHAAIPLAAHHISQDKSELLERVSRNVRDLVFVGFIRADQRDAQPAVLRGTKAQVNRGLHKARA